MNDSAPLGFCSGLFERGWVSRAEQGKSGLTASAVIILESYFERGDKAVFVSRRITRSRLPEGLLDNKLV